MPIPNLHIFRPPDSVHSEITQWIAEVQQCLAAEPDWDQCSLRQMTYDSQAGFHVPTQIGAVRRNLGPVIFIKKVQMRCYDQFRTEMNREVRTFLIDPICPEDILETCELAKRAYDNGEPHIPLRELIAYLIIAKMVRHDFWGGAHNYIWLEDLQNGGFPKDYSERRVIAEVVDALFNQGILQRKIKVGKFKYALGDPAIITPIFETKSFGCLPRMRGFFDASPKYVPAQLLSYID